MATWRTRTSSRGLLIAHYTHGVTISTPYGETMRAEVTSGRWNVSTEAILGMAGIHSPEVRARCTTALEKVGVMDRAQSEVFDIHPHALLRVLLRHGGKRPPMVGLPFVSMSIHEHCTTEKFDQIMADLVDMDMDEAPSTRYEAFLEFVHDLLEMKPNVRTGMFACMMVTSRLEHWGDGFLFQLPQAVAYAISAHPAWRKAALEWLLPHRKTWVPDYMRRTPKVRAMVRLAARKVPGVPSWLYRP